ncbi:MAG: type II toxin-antitoxin system RelE/ParE family toxin [Alphaproteobacteria bacterium]|nr:type II toxin-antitoxin system RelE/ParE family toxin [Alphaproteobacteria bacterium]
MTRPVRLRPAAERDLERLAEFIVEHDPKAALRAVRVLRQAILSLEELPERGRPGPRADLRELFVRFGQSHYVIRYQVRPDAIVVTRIWHAREVRG